MPVLKLLVLFAILQTAWVRGATSPNDPTTEWFPLIFQPGVVSDYIEDQQTGSGESDMIGTNGLPSIYGNFLHGTTPTNGTIGWRIRVGRDESPSGYKGVAVVAIDGNFDGKLDIFATVDNSGSPDAIRIFRGDPNSANISPATTDLDTGNPLFEYTETATNYDWSPVNGVIDPAVLVSTNPTPTNIDGRVGSGDSTDYFVSFFIPFADLVSAFNSVGIYGVVSNSPLRFIAGTATQPNSLNQDINGLNGALNSTNSYTNIFTIPTTPTGQTNNFPVANADTATTPENVPVTISPLVNDTDLDGHPLTITNIVFTNGLVSIQNSTNLVYTPATNFVGVVVINYTISDGQGGFASSTVTVTVTPVNSGPVANDDVASTPEDTAVTIFPLNNDTDLDENTLIITDATSTNGTVVIQNSTNLLFTPALNFNGQVVLNYSISDGNGGSDSAIITVTVTPVNDGPVANNDSTTTPEDTAVTIFPLLNDTDIDGANLIITDATSTNGTVTVQNSTNLLFTPALNFTGTVVLEYTISDQNGGTASALVTVTVTPVNDGPVANDDSATTPEDVAVTIPVLLNDSDIEGNTLTIIDSTTTNGTVSVQNSTNLFYTPAANYNGTVVLGYTISDGNGGTASAVVTVTVTPVNDAPVANNDVATTPEDTAVTIFPLLNDTDIDGDTLIITEATSTNGTLTVQNSTNLLFSPALNFNGTVVLNYTISDQNGGTASAIVTVTVTPGNDGPVANNDTATTPEDVAVTIPVLLNDSDIEGNTLTIIDSTTTNGTVSVQNSTNLFYTPAANYNGTVVLGYTISDGNGGTASAVVTVTVTPVNDAPVANNDVATTPEDTAVTIFPLLNDTDIDGDTLIITEATSTNGTLTVQNSTNLLFSPALNFNGTVVLNYTISDQNGGTASAIVTVTVTSGNDGPVANNDVATTPEDVAVTIPALLNDTDLDGNVLVITGATTTNGTVTVQNSTNLLFRAATNYNGVVVLGYTISDGNGGSASAIVTVTVTPVNDGPIANNDVATTPEDTAVTILPLANDTDVDGNTLIITAATSTNGTVTIQNSTNLLYRPSTNFNGVVVLNYSISDSNGGTASANVTVNVTPVNDGLIAANDVATTPEDVAVTIFPLVNDSDLDGDALTITTATTTNGTVTVQNSTNLLFRPSTNFVGVVVLGYNISDGNGASASASVTVTVTPVNDGPVANNDVATTPEDVSVTVSPLVNDSDLDGDALVITTASTTNGTVTVQNSTNLVFTPATNFVGVVSLGYTISDGNSGSASATVTVTVTPLNDGPVANNDAATTSEDVAVTIPAVLNDVDPDGDALVITSATTTNGTVTVQNSTNLFFTPAANYSGSVLLNYSITDGNQGTASATVTVTVTPANDGPTASDDTTTTTEDTAVTIFPLDNDSDPDGDSLTIIDATTTNGVVTIQNSTNLVFTPATNFTGTVVLNYTISDGNQGTASARVTVTVIANQFMRLGFTSTAPTFNPQTGLFERRVTVTNTGTMTAGAVRVLVGGLRTGVTLYNATGNVGSRPYVQYNAPLDPQQSVTLMLEFYVADRKTFTCTLEVQAVLPTTYVAPTGSGVVIDRMFMDKRSPNDPRYVMEFKTVPGEVYTVIYSDDAGNWQAATPSIKAVGTRTQWYDDGPPKTSAKVSGRSLRVYKVFKSGPAQ